MPSTVYVPGLLPRMSRHIVFFNVSVSAAVWFPLLRNISRKTLRTDLHHRRSRRQIKLTVCSNSEEIGLTVGVDAMIYTVPLQETK